MNKRINIDGSSYEDHVNKTIKDASEIGFVIQPLFMIGWPGETAKTLRLLEKTIVSLAEENENVHPYLSFITPHPGSKLERDAEKLGLKIVNNDLSKYTHLYPVAVPNSLGPHALELMIETYNDVARRTKTEKWNPPIEIKDGMPVYQ
jgi:radical SAM superfamily enzyme YgiQ (UPF0313 family)